MFNIPTYLIEQQVLAADTDTVTLTYTAPSVAWTPRHLLIRINARTGRGNTRDTINVRFNGDTGANYNTQRLSAVASSAAAGRLSAQTSLVDIIEAAADSASANVFGGGELLVPDAFSTRSHKSVVAFSGGAEAGVRANAGRWADTSAITSVTLRSDNSADLLTLSTFDLCVVDESFNHTEEII